MLKFYYHPLSPVARRVWIALLEKEIPFEPVVVELNKKQQFEADFLAMNPFHHVPVVVHNDVCLIESFAILDYLDRQFPENPLSPESPADFAKMRMVQMAALNELSSQMLPFIAAADSSAVAAEQQSQVETCLLFLAEQLQHRDYLGGTQINLADITAGLTVCLLRRLGVSLSTHTALDSWCTRLEARAAWQSTRPSEDAFEQWRRYVRLQVRRSQRKLH